MKTPAQVLREAAALVEKGHCKEAFARNRRGEETNSFANDAVSWCASGAIKCSAATESCAVLPAHAALEALLEAAGLSLFADITDWNDAPERTAAEVAAAMRKAAENLEKQQ